jgi:prephenate dehydrogenase
MNEMTLLSSVFITLYFVIGSRLEEAKLLDYHGGTYRRYMARVPGLIPLPWKTLTTEEAKALLKQQDNAETEASM